MKNWVFIVLFGFWLVGCEDSLEITKENLLGNWYSCVEEQGYIEHYINDEYIEYCAESSIELEGLSTYYISNDTIFFRHGKTDGFTNYYIIKSIAENKLIFQIGDRKMTLKRIPDIIKEKKKAKNIEEHQAIKEEFIKEFWNRKEKYGCRFKYLHKGEAGILQLEEE